MKKKLMENKRKKEHGRVQGLNERKKESIKNSGEMRYATVLARYRDNCRVIHAFVIKPNEPCTPYLYIYTR